MSAPAAQADCRALPATIAHDAHGTPVTVTVEARPGAAAGERALVVIGSDGDVAVALRERLDRAYVTVLDAAPRDALSALESCRPWPWMVVGAVPEVGHAVLAALRDRPILVLWLGPSPTGLPLPIRAFTRFSDLAGAAAGALGADVAGIRLSIGSGLLLPGGEQRRNPELEALVCAHPHPFRLPRSRFRSAGEALRRHGIGWETSTSAAGVVLRPAGSAR
jgi:hypothetical protein